MATPPTAEQQKARGTADRATGQAPSPGRGRSPSGTTVVISAGGYPRPADGDKGEIERLERWAWSPSTLDFRQTALATRAAARYEATSASTFFGALCKAPKPILRLIFVGHGFGDALGLGSDSTLGADDLAAYETTIKESIRPRLAPGATLDLVACNSATKATFAQQLADSLGVTVRGFSTGVCWCVAWRGPSGPISSRGEIAVPTTAKAGCRDAQGRCVGTRYSSLDRLFPPIVVKPRAQGRQ